MSGVKPKELANLIVQKRGSMGLRAAAKEIGIGSATLSRLEKGSTADLTTLEKVYTWLEVDISQHFGGKSNEQPHQEIQVAFKSKNAISPETARAITNLIIAAHSSFAHKINVEGH
jgi:transcriptional regulator with XRE-family HTH domain